MERNTYGQGSGACRLLPLLCARAEYYDMFADLD